MRPFARKLAAGARLAAVLIAAASAGAALGGRPVDLRVESFTVPPSTQPLVFVEVTNLQEAPYQGAVAMKAPEGWRIAPARRDVSLAAGETKRVPFTVERGRNAADNRYAIEVSATGAGTTVVRKQDVACASAPYFKPTIDGDTAEWKDAIPVTFTTAGKKTVVSTYWNRRRFSILVAVEEDKLISYAPDEPPAGSGGCFDAVQIAIAPQDTTTGTSPADEATRFEFLLVAAGKTSGKCFRLARPGMKLAETQDAQSLAPLEYTDAMIAVARTGGVTYYECSIPFTPMRDRIRPSEGREFFMSLLVHDPDGTGIRDFGAAAGLGPSRRNRLAWSRWAGAKWGERPPLDCRLRWGLCTSKY